MFNIIVHMECQRCKDIAKSSFASAVGLQGFVDNLAHYRKDTPFLCDTCKRLYDGLVIDIKKTGEAKIAAFYVNE